jgi:hypothetical protein
MSWKTLLAAGSIWKDGKRNMKKQTKKKTNENAQTSKNTALICHGLNWIWT